MLSGNVVCMEDIRLPKRIFYIQLCGVPGNLNSCECETGGRALLSMTGYVNHVKSHEVS